MKNRYLIPVFFFLLPGFQAWPQSRIELPVFASGFNLPVDIKHAGDGRLFVVEKAGRIRILNSDGSIRAQPFLDITDRVRSSGNEQGLLGLAFHPKYASNGFFYVNYTNSAGDTRIVRFAVSTADPNRADPNSELLLLEIDQPYANHNGGDLHFGPNGYLYAGLGDGGSGGDPQNYAQTASSLLGKMLRLDVDREQPYAIPPSNPFVNDANTRDEIWALGLRNPWRFSFDRQTGDLWIADVGQNKFEEINFEPAGDKGGRNYGWRCYEGTATFSPAGCPPVSQLTSPVHVYNHPGSGCRSVTGGYVYRGEAYPSLRGYYLYADYCTGEIWGIRRTGNDGFANEQLLQFRASEIVSFGEDADGELYVAGISTGRIYRVVDQCGALRAPNIRFAGDILSAPDTFAAYQWLLNGEPITGAVAAEYAPGETGAYSVEVTDARGCRVVSQAYTLTSITGAVGIRWWQVTPNPFRDRFRLEVELTEPAAFQVKLYDAGGRLILLDRLDRDTRWVRQYQLKDLRPGLYFLSLQRGKQQVVMKLLKSE